MVRQPCVQVASKIMSVRAPTPRRSISRICAACVAACLRLAKFCARVLQTAVRSRHAPPTLPAGCAPTGCNLTKRRHGGISFGLEPAARHEPEHQRASERLRVNQEEQYSQRRIGRQTPRNEAAAEAHI